MEIGVGANIQLNKPVFGMAFIKPSADDIQSFTEYIYKNGKTSIVKRGLKQLTKDQTANKHFDIKYESCGNAIQIIPKTEKAKEMYGLTRIDESKIYPARSQGLSMQELDKVTATRSKFAQKLILVKNIFKHFTANIKTIVQNPKETLPANLRAADDFALQMEKSVEAQIAREKLLEVGKMNIS